MMNDNERTLMEKTASWAVYLMSQADIRSMPSPITAPCTAAMTGKGHRSGATMACWNSRRYFRMVREARAESLD